MSYAWILVAMLQGGTPPELVWTVNSTRDAVDAAPGDWTCSTGRSMPDGSPECTLRAAVMEANVLRSLDPPNRIVVPEGTFTLRVQTISRDDEHRAELRGALSLNAAAASGDLDVDGLVTIIGAGPGRTIIDGAGAGRVFDFRNERLASVYAVEQLTVRHGTTLAGQHGACLRHERGEAELSLVEMVIESCFAQEAFGGGLYAEGVTVMRRITFRRNGAAAGGGAYNRSPLMRIEESTFDANTAFSAVANVGGGAIANVNNGLHAGLDLQTSTLVNSTNGALLNRGLATVSNTTITGNRGDGVMLAGDGAEPSGLDLLHTTVTNNTGRAVSRASSAGPLHLSHTILTNNGASRGGDNCSGPVTRSEYSLEDGFSCGLAGAGDISGADPLLRPLADNGGPTHTHALGSSSPAIDAGYPSSTLPPFRTDQRGFARPLGAASDIGAYESGHDPLRLRVTVPIRWFRLFAVPLLEPTRFSLAMTLDTGKDGDADARIVGVKAAAGQQLKFALDQDGRAIRIEGIATPPKDGQDADGDPVLFYLEVQRPEHGASRIRLSDGACECDGKLLRQPIVLPPVKGGQQPVPQ
jgi:CSLREA domain-containing protein